MPLHMIQVLKIKHYKSKHHTIFKIHLKCIVRMFGKILFPSWQFESHHKICDELMFSAEQMSTAALESCQTFEI